MRAVTLLLLFAVAVGAAEKLIPARVTEDFLHASLGQWASYPPVQDIGYDPSISPTSEYGAPGGRSLLRIYRPPGPGAWSFGFIRRFDLASSGKVKIGFSYRVKPVPPGTTLEVGLAGADGHLYKKKMPVAPGEGWANASVEFGDIPTGVAIEAIYLTARVADADPDFDYRFLVDNIAIDAAQPARFDVLTPKSVSIAHWQDRVSMLSYAPGERISIEMKSEIPLANVTCTLQDQDGHEKKSAALTLQSSAWRAESFYQVQSSDTPGFWRASIRGRGSDGREVATNIRMVVRKDRSNSHPRLIEPGKRALLLERTRDPKFQPLWQNFSNLAKSSRTTGDLVVGANGFSRLDTRYLLPTLFGYFSVFNRADSRILNNVIVGYVSDDETAIAAAKQAMLDVAAWPKWVPPWFEAHGQHTYYPAGELASTMAFGYDILYDRFSPAERAQIDAAIREHGIRATFEEYVADNRLMAGTSNWIGHTVGGALAAAAAIDDGKDDPQLNIWLGGLLLKFEDHLAASYLADGSYGEGISYQEFDLKTIAPALTALRNTFGLDYWKRSHVMSSLTYPLYALAFPPSAGTDMGDSHPPTGYSSASIVEQSSDPAVKWYFSHFSPKSVLTFLSRTEGAGAPPKETSRLFAQKGTAIFRTGWTADDAIVMFRAGPNFNHNHSDQGSFLLRAFGEDLVAEAGFAGYYKDPYYLPYFTQAAGHNTVLVDGNPASQDIADTAQFRALHRYPSIQSATLGEHFNSVSSELASVYRDKLKHYGRRLQFLKPNYLVIYDELESASTAAKFNWLLHVKDRDALTVSGSDARYRGTKASMLVKAIEPPLPVLAKSEGHLPESLFSTTIPVPTPPMPAVLKIGTPAAAATQRFLVVLAFDRSIEGANSLAAKVAKVTGRGCIGTRIGTTLALFRDVSANMLEFEDWRTDAGSLTAGDRLLAAEFARNVTRAGKILWTSDIPATFAIESDASGASLFVNAHSAANIRILLDFRPSKLPAGVSHMDGGVTMQLAAGLHRFRFDK